MLGHRDLEGGGGGGERGGGGGERGGGGFTLTLGLRGGQQQCQEGSRCQKQPALHRQLPKISSA